MRTIRRREFLGALGLGAAGSLIAPNIPAANAQIKITPNIPAANAQTKQRIQFAKRVSEHPMDTRIAVKPVYWALIHSDVWEGPCRPSTGKNPPKETDWKAQMAIAVGRTPEQEKADAREGVKAFADELKANLNPDIRLLDAVLLEMSEDFRARPEELAKLEAENDKTDVYLLGRGLTNYTGNVIAERFKKPVVTLAGTDFIGADLVASLETRGLEGYAVFDVQELNYLLSLMGARKVFQQTNILIITDRGLPPVPVRSCMDVNMLKEKFGIGSHFVSYHEFENKMDEIINSKEWGRKAQERAEQLIENAAETHIDKQHVKRSFEFYYAVKDMMQTYGCNAFTVECFELCASRIAEKYRITPCLVHTLLKDEGTASACEEDLNALLAMRLLMSVSNKSSFMGNTYAMAEDRIYLWHSVPGIKMAGYDKPDLPYHLRNFVESGWGTKVMIDFNQFEEKTVTLTRLDQLGTKIYLAKGEIVDCTGFNKGNLIGCSLAAHIKVPDSKEFMRKQGQFGSHLSMVYGDYTQEIRDLAGMMNFEVVYAT